MVVRRALPAYSDDLADEDMFETKSGILANILQSCARSIHSCFKDTGIKGTHYHGVNVLTASVLNPYMGANDGIDAGGQMVTVMLSLGKSSFGEQVNANIYHLYPTVDARIIFPRPQFAYSVKDAIESDRQYRDPNVRLAVVDGLFAALSTIVYYRGEENTGITLNGNETEYSDPVGLNISVSYLVRARVQVSHRAAPEKLTVVAKVVDESGEGDEGVVAEME